MNPKPPDEIAIKVIQDDVRSRGWDVNRCWIGALPPPNQEVEDSEGLTGWDLWSKYLPPPYSVARFAALDQRPGGHGRLYDDEAKFLVELDPNGWGQMRSMGIQFDHFAWGEIDVIHVGKTVLCEDPYSRICRLLGSGQIDRNEAHALFYAYDSPRFPGKTVDALIAMMVRQIEDGVSVRYVYAMERGEWEAQRDAGL